MKMSRYELGWILGLAVLFGLLAYAGIQLTRSGGRVAMLWLPNAIAAAWLLRSRTDAMPLYVCACFFANVAANRIVGDTWATGAGLALANAVEISIVVCLMRKVKGRRPDLSEVDSHVWLFISAIAGSFVSATIASTILAGPGEGISPSDWERWIIADALSLMIILPICLVLIDAWRNREQPSKGALLNWMSMIVLVVAGTAFVFAQTTYPFLFLTSPLIIFAAFRTGLLGTAVAMLIITLIASVATSIGSGPIALVRGGADMQLVAFQTFLASNFIIGFPVAALLAERARDRSVMQRERDDKREVVDNIRDIIFRTDDRGCWTSLNPAWEKLTGYTVEESLGWSTTRLLHPDDLAATSEIYPRIVTGELKEATLKQRFVDRSGASRHIEVGVRRLAAEDGSFAGTIGNIRDISKEVHQAEELADSELRFRRLAESAPVGIFRANAEGELTYINPGWAAKLGLTVKQALGRGWMQAVADLEPLREQPPFQDFKPGELRRRDIKFRGADGKDLWMETYNSAEFDESGNVKGYYGAAVDVSEARELEANLRLARRTAEEAATAKSAFLANMSHEIRTPMNGVIGSADLLEQTELDEDQRGYVRMIAESGHGMMQLLNDILDISKIEAGQLQIATEPFYLRHKLAGITKLMQPEASRRGLTLTLEVSSRLPTCIEGDPLRLNQVVLNLVGNAIKFTKKGGIHVEVAAVDAGRSLQIDVADTGIGIAPENLAAIFQQFTQADASIVRRFGGTGLGLAISKQLVEMMGGKLSVESTLGKGSTFSVIIPLVAAKEPEHLDAADSSHTPRPGSYDGQLRLLIAEDNEINQKLIVAMARKARCMPHLVPDGEAVIRAVAEAERIGEPFSLVLMDLQMPKLDGLSAARALRSKGYDAARLPIIALTANAYQDDIVSCLDAGMQGHIAKPLRMQDLTDVVEAFGVRRDSTEPAGREEYEEAASIPGLSDKYQARKDAIRAQLSELSESNIEEHWEALAGSLHQLAGVAAYFGEEDLGEKAYEIERELGLAKDAHARLIIARNALAALDRAA